MSDLILGYFDGELDFVRTLEIEDHLKQCPHCSREYQNQKTLRSAIRSGSLYFKPTAQFTRRLEFALRRADKARAPSRQTVWWSLLGPSWAWTGVVASLALVTIVTWSLAHRSSRTSTADFLAQEVLSGHIRSLMANHLTDVSSSDQHTVKPWFNGKLDFSPIVQELKDEGFPLVGGRLDYLANRPVAALVYQRRKHFINLFIWPSPLASDAATRVEVRQGYNLFRWTKSGMAYWAVSDLNQNEMNEFVRLVQRQTTLPAKP